MTDPMSDDHQHHDDAQLGWQLAHVRQIAGNIAVLALGIEQRLEGFAPSALQKQIEVALDADDLTRIVDGALELEDAADALAAIASSFRPRETRLVFTADEVSEQAGRALSEGSGDAGYVGLAACLLDTGEGFGSLASAITADAGFLAHWGDLTVCELLVSFRRSDDALARQVCLAAQIDPELAWADLDEEATRRLAEALGTQADE